MDIGYLPDFFTNIYLRFLFSVFHFIIYLWEAKPTCFALLSCILGLLWINLFQNLKCDFLVSILKTFESSTCWLKICYSRPPPASTSLHRGEGWDFRAFQDGCLLLLVSTRSAHHARHGLTTMRARVDIDVINDATKYAIKWKQFFFYCVQIQV